MAEEEGISGGRRKDYRRVLILSAMCFMIGIWFLSFPVINFMWKDSAPGMLLLDLLAMAGGVVMIVFGFTIWKGATS